MISLLEDSLYSSLYNACCDTHPFLHWTCQNVFTEDFLFNLLNIDPPPSPSSVYDGTRAGDSLGYAQNDNNRMYFSLELVKQHPFLQDLINILRSPSFLEMIGLKFDTDFSDCYLRGECIFDRNGFFLHPHEDIKEKRLTLFIYLGSSPEEYGTDLYDENKQWIKKIPFKNNTGYIFVPGNNTWHGFEPREITGYRRALLVNYVTFKTPWSL